MAAPGHDGQYDPVRAGVEHRQISGIPRACGWLRQDGRGRACPWPGCGSVKLSKLYDTKELKDSLNRYLPEDIRIVKVELVKNGFHARKSAKGKKI